MSESDDKLRELVSRACESGEQVLLSLDGAPVAAIVSLSELDDLETAVSELCQAIKAHSHGLGIPHEQVMALLAARDADGST